MTHPRARPAVRGLRTADSGLPDSRARQRFRRRLLTWYRRFGRDLPWRRTRDPYHILVSEVMLQQTQVDRVLPKYEQWLEKYPTLEALATAPEDDVSMTWRPLGYNVRPRRLHAIAKESCRPIRRRAALGRRDAALVQGDRGVYGRCGPELRVRSARGDPRHQRRTRAVSRVRWPRRPEVARLPAAPVDRVA